jgi:hypothetical protein
LKVTSRNSIRSRLPNPQIAVSDDNPAAYNNLDVLDI